MEHQGASAGDKELPKEVMAKVLRESVTETGKSGAVCDEPKEHLAVTVEGSLIEVEGGVAGEAFEEVVFVVVAKEEETFFGGGWKV